jgi:hypothetical protein
MVSVRMKTSFVFILYRIIYLGNLENEWVVWNKLVNNWPVYMKKKSQWIKVNFTCMNRRGRKRLYYVGFNSI